MYIIKSCSFSHDYIFLISHELQLAENRKKEMALAANDSGLKSKNKGRKPIHDLKVAATKFYIVIPLFFQSLINLSNPISVSGCLISSVITLYGMVQISAPSIHDSTKCKG